MAKERNMQPKDITRLREQTLGLNKVQFAQLIGVTRETIGTWEAGTHEPKGAGRKALMDLAAKRRGKKK
jgi:DNA-binding transcriptional regulator YiaG